MSNDQPKMTGAQLQMHHAEIKREVMRLVDDVKLRQWCVEQVAKVCCTDLQIIKEVTEYWYNFATNKGE